jgi:hypothetical protein
MVDKMFPNLRAEKFSIAITPETPSVGTRISPKQTESGQNGRAREILEAEDPVVTCGTVDKNERIPEPTRGDAVAESNINMNNVIRDSLCLLCGNL